MIRNTVSRPRWARCHVSGTCKNGRSRTTSLPAISTSIRASPALFEESAVVPSADAPAVMGATVRS
jgi:hypothetical protein